MICPDQVDHMAEAPAGAADLAVEVREAEASAADRAAVLEADRVDLAAPADLEGDPEVPEAREALIGVDFGDQDGTVPTVTAADALAVFWE